MRETILLHVGAPKTGSTYFQRRLRASSEGLRAQGVYVPVLPAVAAMAGNAKLLATALSGTATESFRRAFPTLDPNALDPRTVMSDLLRNWDPAAETLVLSAENLRAEHAVSLRALLPLTVEVRIVLVARRQDDWVQSYYNQLVKTRDVTIDFNRFVYRVCASSKPPLYRPDWEAQMLAWREAFGDCRLVPFEAAAGDLWSAIFRAAELPVPNVPDIPPEQQSLDLNQLAFLLSLPVDTPIETFGRYRRAAAQASSLLGAPAKESILQPADRAFLVETFQVGNARLADVLGNNAAPLPIMESDPLPVTTLKAVRERSTYQAFDSLVQDIAGKRDVRTM